MQVDVRYNDLGISVVDLLNDGGDGIVRREGCQVAALTRQDFQAALRFQPGQHRVLDANQLHGLFQFPEVLTGLVHGKDVILGLFQVGRVEGDKEGFALLGYRQVFQRLFVRRRKTLVEHLGDSGTGGTFRHRTENNRCDRLLSRLGTGSFLGLAVLGGGSGGQGLFGFTPSDGSSGLLPSLGCGALLSLAVLSGGSGGLGLRGLIPGDRGGGLLSSFGIGALLSLAVLGGGSGSRASLGLSPATGTAGSSPALGPGVS